MERDDASASLSLETNTDTVGIASSQCPLFSVHDLLVSVMHFLPPEDLLRTPITRHPSKVRRIRRYDGGVRAVSRALADAVDEYVMELGLRGIVIDPSEPAAGDTLDLDPPVVNGTNRDRSILFRNLARTLMKKNATAWRNFIDSSRVIRYLRPMGTVLGEADSPFMTELLGRADTQLEVVDFSECLIADEHLILLLGMSCVESLTSLSLGPNCSDASLLYLDPHDHCGTLKSLDVSRTAGKVSDKGISHVASCSPNLQCLNLASTGGNITIRSMSSVARHCHQLTTLNIRRTILIADSTIETIARSCPLLEDLDVSYTTLITDESLTKVAALCHRLQRLLAECCEGMISVRTLDAIEEHLGKTIRFLSFNGSQQLMTSQLEAIQSKCSQLQLPPLREWRLRY